MTWTLLLPLNGTLGVEGEVQAVSTDRRVLEGEVALEVMDAHGMLPSTISQVDVLG